MLPTGADSMPVVMLPEIVTYVLASTVMGVVPLPVRAPLEVDPSVHEVAIAKVAETVPALPPPVATKPAFDVPFKTNPPVPSIVALFFMVIVARYSLALKVNVPASIVVVVASPIWLPRMVRNVLPGLMVIVPLGSDLLPLPVGFVLLSTRPTK